MSQNRLPLTRLQDSIARVKYLKHMADASDCALALYTLIKQFTLARESSAVDSLLTPPLTLVWFSVHALVFMTRRVEEFT